MPKPRFSILLLTYTRTDLLEARLAEIDRHLVGPAPSFEVVVCDNGSPNRSASLVVSTAKLTARPYALNLIRLDPNRGFGGAFNHLMDEAEGEILVCLSDDVAITGNFLPLLDTAFHEIEASLVGQTLTDGPAGWNSFDGKLISYLQGYFLAAPSWVWTLLGRFDTQFYPNDYEDLDLSMTAHAKGIPLVALSQLPLVHKGAQTIGYSPDRMNQTVKMRALFAKKWSLPNIPERP